MRPDIPHISSAAFWVVAAAAQRRGHLLVRDVGFFNHTCLVFCFGWVRKCARPLKTTIPRGIVEVTGFPLRGTVIQGKEVPQLIDELAILDRGALADARRSFATQKNCA